MLEETLEDADQRDEEWGEGIRRHVFPVLEAERERLGAEYVRLRVGYKD